MRTYEQIVAEAQGVESGRNWRLGDLALEVETSYGDNTLERFATDIGVEYESLRQYRYVASRYENGIRIPNLSWRVHQVFAALDDRAELVASRRWTVSEARDHVSRRRNVVSDVRPFIDAASHQVDEARRFLADVRCDAAARVELLRELAVLEHRVSQLRTDIEANDMDAQLTKLLDGQS